eukprot:SAG31_NODE_4279_length_3383_cov_4.832521_5_plen_50_part_00
MVDQPNNEGQNGFISTFNIDGTKFVKVSSFTIYSYACYTTMYGTAGYTI